MLKTYRPMTAGQRQKTSIDFSVLTKKRPEPRLTKSVKKTGGRNHHGHITVRHRGGGSKRRYRMVDFNQTDKLNIPATVKAIEYDPNRNVFIALLFYADGEKRYVLAPQKVKVGFKLLAAEKTVAQPGNRMMVKNIPEGMDIYNLELHPKMGGKLVRAAGISAKLTSLEGENAQVRMPSGEVRYIHKECFASIGVLGNADHINISVGKAGRTRWMGKRPQVRGKVMNPVDHPHGGGEGRNPIGLKHPKTPWGKSALGTKTRRRKFTNRMIVQDRRFK